MKFFPFFFFFFFFCSTRSGRSTQLIGVGTQRATVEVVIKGRSTDGDENREQNGSVKGPVDVGLVDEALLVNYQHTNQKPLTGFRPSLFSMPP
jgi:hypothetical protein